ncbi:MAG: RNA polymerase sigma factor [Sandaracinaceae bacterium]|nr:RNA polymerase sigma factor [Sandaracinaceae bacterium]
MFPRGSLPPPEATRPSWVSASMEERRLIERLVRNETAALGEAYDLHHAAVRGFSRRLLGHEAAAEDLVHDVFLQLPKVIGRFEARSSLRTFLLSIAVNLSRNVRRARSRRDDALERMHLEPRSANETPEELEDRRRLAILLSRLLDELPMEQRVAVVLCVIEERTSVEAAEIAGVPEATVRTRLFHARRKLRERLEQHLTDRDEPAARDKELGP